MHEILHVFGICPDSMGHPDLLDFIFLNWVYVNELLNLKIFIIKQKIKTWISR